MAKKVTGEDGKTYKVKKPFYKRVWFWILVVILVVILGNSLGGGKSDNKNASNDNSAKTSEKTSNGSTTKTDSTLKDNFNKISIGDILSEGDGGSSLEDVKSTFGEPDSTSETNIEGHSAKMLTWGAPKGGELMSSLVVSFSNDKAVSKAVTGLKIAKNDNKASLENFNAITTDGNYSEDKAKQEFGEPDGISESLVNGKKQTMLSWSKNADGDIGANLNVTFDDGMATSKSQMGLK